MTIALVFSQQTQANILQYGPCNCDQTRFYKWLGFVESYYHLPPSILCDVKLRFEWTLLLILVFSGKIAENMSRKKSYLLLVNWRRTVGWFLRINSFSFKFLLVCLNLKFFSIQIPVWTEKADWKGGLKWWTEEINWRGWLWGLKRWIRAIWLKWFIWNKQMD